MVFRHSDMSSILEVKALAPLSQDESDDFFANALRSRVLRAIAGSPAP